VRGAVHAYRTPLWLTAVFGALLVIFALTPDPQRATGAAEPASEPTPGPRECVVCPIDQQCDARSGQCVFVDHTPLPCVKGAKFDDEAGFCLPTGAPAAPAPADTDQDRGRIPAGPRFPSGIDDDNNGAPRQPDLPGFGN
jgi:hypothetical protein